MRAHETVLSWVTAKLSSGELAVGDRLPSERTLAETLGVSRNSLREAMRILEAMGVVHSSTGSGPRAGTIITAAPEQAMGMALKLQLASSQVRPQDVFDTRLLLETAAMRDGDPRQCDVSAAEHILDAMDAPDLGIAEFLRLDAEFHVALSRAAGNPLISTLMGSISLAIYEHTLELSEGLPDWRRTAERLQMEHRAIVSALKEGHRQEAAGLLEGHIRGYYRETRQAQMG